MITGSGSTASVADSIRSMDTVGGADVDLVREKQHMNRIPVFGDVNVPISKGAGLS